VTLARAWVDPLHRRKGVGRALAEAVKAWAVEQGAGTLEAQVTEANGPAIRFYATLHFADTGHRESLLSNPTLQIVFLSRPLWVRRHPTGHGNRQLVDGGDGDPDIVSKIWNKDGPTYHVVYWRNDTLLKQWAWFGRVDDPGARRSAVGRLGSRRRRLAPQTQNAVAARHP
jgi:hypothetical protein